MYCPKYTEEVYHAYNIIRPERVGQQQHKQYVEMIEKHGASMNMPINRFKTIEAANERIRELEEMVDYLRSRELPAPNNEIAEIFHLINIGAPIDEQLLEHSFYSILTSPHIRARDFQLGALLSGLMVRGPTAKEIACLIRTALRVDGITRIKTALPRGEKLICVAGSGKKGQKTFNISTPSCLVACAAGAYIAKPCSAATSSITGSKDFLLLVGANLNGTEEMVDVMVGTGFGAYSIEAMVPRFDSVYGGRVYSPTPLSFALPAMINPVVCDSVFYGVSHPDISLALEVFSELGYKDAILEGSGNALEQRFQEGVKPLPLVLEYQH